MGAQASPTQRPTQPGEGRITGAKPAGKRVISHPKRYDRLPERTISYRNFNYLELATSLAKVGVGGSNPRARSKSLNLGESAPA
jgi:hypothetical protein